MIGVILAQLATRWGQALTLFVLSMAATLAAVCVPAFAGAIDRAAVANELAAAEISEITVLLPPLLGDVAEPRTGVTNSSPELPAYADARSMLKGFTPVTSTQIHVRGLGSDTETGETYNLLARDGFCRHVTFRSGRCPVGSREAALPAALAKKVGLGAGEEVVLAPVRRKQDTWEPDGPPVSLTLVGVFEPTHPGAPYWTLEDPFGGLGMPAVFTNRTTLGTLPHRQETVFVDAIMPDRLLTPERIPVLRRQLQAAEERLSQDDPYGTGLLTSLPGLLDRIDAQGTQARALLPIAAAPLIALCWFVIHLAVGHGVWGRRQEFGIVALRGARWPTRALTVSAETLLPLLAGVPAGVAVTRLLVAATAPGDGGVAGLDREQLLAAALATAGSVAAAVVALRRELAAPVGQLLRQVPPRSRRVVVAAVELFVVALGVVVVTELRSLEGELVGIMVAAPVMVILAVAMLASLAAKPLVEIAGRWSLRRGRIGPAVATLHLARRPGSVRLLVVLALVFGTFGFAAAATDVAAEGRQAEAQQLLGADRVLDVQEVDREKLLRAVRAADPKGTDAMAVVSVPSKDGAPPVLALDSTRLAHVATWSGPFDAPDAAKLAAQLRPPAAKPIMVGNGELTAELRPDPFTSDGTLTVSLLLRSPHEGDQVAASFGPVSSVRPDYKATVKGCDEGCRLVGISLSTSDSEAERVGVTVGALREDGRDVVTPQQFADASRWRSPEQGPVTEQLRFVGDEEGMLLTQPNPQPGDDYALLSVDVPYPLPAVTAGAVPGRYLTNVDDEQVRFASRTKLEGLPGVGGRGALVDLEYAERLTTEPGYAADAKVWLTGDAPDRIVHRLRDQGLVIVEDRTVGSLRATMEQSGAAMALQSYQLAAGVTVLVGLGALALVVAVDRRTWSPGMRALREQGVAERMTTAAALWSYGGIVVTSAVTGALAAAVAWFAAGKRLPLGVEKSLLGDWPRMLPVLALECLVVGVLLAGAVAGGWWQRRLVRGQQEGGG